MTRVEVDRRILEWAIKRSGKSVDELKSRQTLRKIDEWLAGELDPTLRQLEDLSRATLTPFGYLMLSEPPKEELPVPDYRVLPDGDLREPSPELMSTIHTMQRRQNWMREYLQDIGQDELPFVNSFDTTFEDAEKVAQEMRNVLNLKRLWAKSLPNWNQARGFLKEAMEDAGIVVVFNSVLGNNTHRKLDVEEFRGFVLTDVYAPLVFVNSNDSISAQIFTLAHEFAHIVYGESGIFDLRHLQPSDNKTEIKCNETAAEFLVPKDELLNSWHEAIKTSNPYEKIARQFKVSEIVIARRALDLGLIVEDEFFAFYRDYLARLEDTDDKRGSGGPTFYTMQNYRIGKPFASAVNSAVKEGRILYSEAFKLTGLKGTTFDKYMKRIQD